MNTSDIHADARHLGGFDSERNMHSDWVAALTSLRSMVEYANDTDVDVFNIGGDVFDTGHPTAEAVALFCDEMSRIKPSVSVVIEPGNHDHRSVHSDHRNALSAYLEDKPWCTSIINETKAVEINGLTIVGVPWYRVAGVSHTELSSRTLRDDIMRVADEVRTPASILVGHLTLEETSFAKPETRGSEVFMTPGVTEATIPVSVIDQGPWALARLGHIHTRQQVSKKTGYTGSPTKVTFKEADQQKGFDVVTFGPRGGASLEFVPLATRGLYVVDLDPAVGQSLHSISDTATRGDIVRVFVSPSETPPTLSEDVSLLRTKGVFVEVLRKPTPRLDAASRVPGIDLSTSPTQAIDAFYDRLKVPSEKREALNRVYSTYLGE